MADSSFNIQNYFKRGKTVVLTLRQGDPDEVRQWSDKDTGNLLSFMNTYLPEFRNPRRRKKEVWADISKELTDEGYFWTPEDCRKKWSNMVRTFKGIQEQKMDPVHSNKKTKWPFFEYMMDLFISEGADCLPEATNIIQLLNISVQTPDVSLQSNRLVEEVPASAAAGSNRDSVILADPQDIDMVGVAVDLASIINTGDETTLDVNSTNIGTTEIEVEPIQTSNSSRNVTTNSNRTSSIKSQKGPGSSNSRTTSGQGQHQTLSSPSLKTYIKRGFKRKGNKSKPKTLSENDAVGDSLLDKFMALTNKQNEQILGHLSSFQESAIQVMQERNNILKRLCTAIEQHSSSTVNQSDNNNDTSCQYQEDDEGNPVNTNSISRNSQNSVSTSYQQVSSSNALVTTMTNSGGTTIEDLSETMIADSVTVVDPESLQGLILQDGNGSFTFHLPVTTNTPENSINQSTMQQKVFRLENIPSDVNLSAFSAALHPTLVSVNPAKKPRTTLSKSVSVPLHTTGNRKIAPRK